MVNNATERQFPGPLFWDRFSIAAIFYLLLYPQNFLLHQACKRLNSASKNTNHKIHPVPRTSFYVMLHTGQIILQMK